MRVDYEELPAVFDVEEAIKAPSFKKDGPNYYVYEGHHCRRIRFGDVEKGFAAADHIIGQRYEFLADRARAGGDHRLHREAGGERTG